MTISTLDARMHASSKPALKIYEELTYRYKSERVEAILRGESKRKTGLTQDEIACLFAFGLDGYATRTYEKHYYRSKGEKPAYDENFRSEDGILWHYSTIEALRTEDGLIINNRNCWSRGFAHCSSPPYSMIDYSLDLSIIGNACANIQQLRSLKVIDQIEESQFGAPATLLTITKRYHKGQWDTMGARERTQAETETVYLLNAADDNGHFVAELKEPCETVKQAFENMKPKMVRIAENLGLKVKRQGELFFIPTDVKMSQVTDTKKRARSPCYKVYAYCTECGLKTTPKKVDRHDMLNNPEHPVDTHPSMGWYGHAPPTWTKKQAECAEKHKWNRDIMQNYYYVGVEYSPYPKIGDTTHTATRLATYTEIKARAGIQTTLTYTVVQGVIRHSEHPSLKLGTRLHIAMRNRITRAWTRSGGVD